VRSLALKAVITLSVLLAAPLLGCDSQARAGIVTLEMLSSPLSILSPLSDSFAEYQEAPSQPSLHAADPVSSLIADRPLPGSHRDAAALALFGQQVPGIPGVPESDSRKDHRVQSLYMADRPEEVSPAGSVSLFRSSARLHLPDPHLCRLFRPPRRANLA
jgi:hypothetical protein